METEFFSKIIPHEIVTTTIITGFSFNILELIPNISAKFRVVIYSDSNPKNVLFVTLVGDDYKQWSTDDNYITKYIANKLGYTLA